MDESLPSGFIDELIEVVYTQPPMLEKVPHCPQGFIWRGKTFSIQKVLTEWHDFRRRGRYEKNMRPSHATTAAVRGSWGVGRYFFRVVTDKSQIFDIYYDRSPSSVSDRKGHWFLMGERKIDLPSA